MQNPVDSASYNFDMLKAVYALLVDKIIDDDYLNTHHHLTVVGKMPVRSIRRRGSTKKGRL